MLHNPTITEIFQGFILYNFLLFSAKYPVAIAMSLQYNLNRYYEESLSIFTKQACKIDSHPFSLHIAGNIFVDFRKSPLLQNSHAEATLRTYVYSWGDTKLINLLF